MTSWRVTTSSKDCPRQSKDSQKTAKGQLKDSLKTVVKCFKGSETTAMQKWFTNPDSDQLQMDHPHPVEQEVPIQSDAWHVDDVWAEVAVAATGNRPWHRLLRRRRCGLRPSLEEVELAIVAVEDWRCHHRFLQRQCPGIKKIWKQFLLDSRCSRVLTLHAGTKLWLGTVSCTILFIKTYLCYPLFLSL